MIHHLFIINPAAGSYNRTEEYSEVIHKICRARHLDYEIRVSTAPGECARIARDACKTGRELRIYACGGPFTFHFHALEKERAIHSSVLAWTIPGTAEPGGLLSMGSHRVGHD